MGGATPQRMTADGDTASVGNDVLNVLGLTTPHRPR